MNTYKVTKKELKKALKFARKNNVDAVFLRFGKPNGVGESLDVMTDDLLKSKDITDYKFW